MSQLIWPNEPKGLVKLNHFKWANRRRPLKWNFCPWLMLWIIWFLSSKNQLVQDRKRVALQDVWLRTVPKCSFAQAQTQAHTNKHTRTNRGAVSCVGALHSVSWVEQDAKHIICNLTHVSCTAVLLSTCQCARGERHDRLPSVIWLVWHTVSWEKKMDELLLISTEECLKCSNLELQESLVRHLRGDKYSNSDEHHTHTHTTQVYKLR